jgi:CHAD domain-containing protein
MVRKLGGWRAKRCYTGGSGRMAVYGRAGVTGEPLEDGRSPSGSDGQGRIGAAPGERAARDLSLSEFAARVVLDQVDRLARHEPGARSGEDPEDLHKMRVATRRLRVAFRVFGRSAARDWGIVLPVDEVREVARALGTVRDIDVFVERLGREARQAGEEDAPALERLRLDWVREREVSRIPMNRALDGEALKTITGNFRRHLQNLVSIPRTATGKTKDRRRVTRVGRRIVVKALRRLRRSGSALYVPVSEELHAIRIEAKRFRYICEFFLPVYGEALSGPIEWVTAVQETLGDLHDSEVASLGLLGGIERVGVHPDRSGDAGAVARLVRKLVEQRDDALRRFRTQWRTVPKEPSFRRRRLAGKRRTRNEQ